MKLKSLEFPVMLANSRLKLKIQKRKYYIQNKLNIKNQYSCTLFQIKSLIPSKREIISSNLTALHFCDKIKSIDCFYKQIKLLKEM